MSDAIVVFDPMVFLWSKVHWARSACLATTSSHPLSNCIYVLCCVVLCYFISVHVLLSQLLYVVCFSFTILMLQFTATYLIMNLSLHTTLPNHLHLSHIPQSNKPCREKEIDVQYLILSIHTNCMHCTNGKNTEYRMLI